MRLNEIKDVLLKKFKAHTRFENIKLCDNNKYYCCKYEDNFLCKMNNNFGIMYNEIVNEMRSGSGNELKDKFRAIHSSSALCVNSFSFFKRSKSVEMPFIHDIVLNGKLKFESKLSTGVSNAKANLDLEIISDDSVVFIESKFLEYYTKKSSLDISVKYYEINETKILIDEFANVNDKHNMDLIKQLICHFTAINNTIKSGVYSGKTIYLCLLYWSSGEVSKEESDLKELLKRFEDKLDMIDINDHKIKFIYSSYNELYEIWNKSSDVDLKEHSKWLKERYII